MTRTKTAEEREREEEARRKGTWSDEFGDTSRFPESDGKGGYTPETIAFSLSREYDGP